jgi:hypothetical protein
MRSEALATPPPWRRDALVTCAEGRALAAVATNFVIRMMTPGICITR